MRQAGFTLVTLSRGPDQRGRLPAEVTRFGFRSPVSSTSGLPAGTWRLASRTRSWRSGANPNSSVMGVCVSAATPRRASLRVLRYDERMTLGERASGRTKHSTVGLLGGLGNQLFQFSYGLWLGRAGDVTFDASALRSGSRRLELAELAGSDRLRVEPWLNLMPYPRGRLGKVGELVRKLRGPRSVRYEEAGLPDSPEDAPAAWWYGYFQSPSRVSEVLPELREALAGSVPAVKPGTVGIHVRRGDYLGNPMLLSPDYYRQALSTLIEWRRLDITSLSVTVFSDDSEWCEKELSFDVPVTYSPPRETLADFRALMECEYLVLSRSTFSWWAAVLPDRPQENVISPFPYTPDPNWVLDYEGWLRQPV